MFNWSLFEEGAVTIAPTGGTTLILTLIQKYIYYTHALQFKNAHNEPIHHFYYQTV